MPPEGFTLERLSYCDSRECVGQVVEDYLNSLLFRKRQSNLKFKLFYDEKELDEKTIANSYIFSEILLRKVIFSDIDIELIIRDLEDKLGSDHPVLVFLKQFKDD
ncbi:MULTISPECIES: hypothetical protein [Acidianus]|nr:MULTISPECIES: hypothetical protein [Acidianus]NON62223.1 hypothetical protein [Acidianus sp. RZ1]